MTTFPQLRMTTELRVETVAATINEIAMDMSKTDRSTVDDAVNKAHVATSIASRHPLTMLTKKIPGADSSNFGVIIPCRMHTAIMVTAISTPGL